MANRNECKFDLMRLAPELQAKVFEALPSPVAAVDLALTCRGLNTLYCTYRTQIMVSIRDNMAAPFYEYYAFHSSLHIPESDIKHPPAGGWPKITPENCSGSGKSDFVLDVLKHLPYIRHLDMDAPHPIDYMSSVVDYSEVRPSVFAANDTRYGEGRARHSRGPGFRHMVGIAKAYATATGGVDIVLDTRTGEVFEERLRAAGGSKPLPVREYLARKMAMCRELRMVFVPGDYVHVDEQYREGEVDEGPPYDAAVMESVGEPVCPSYGFGLVLEIDRDWVCHLYRKFGWPGREWKKEEGLKAIVEYRDKRNAEAENRAAELRRKRDETLQRLGPVVGVLHCF